MDISNCVYRIFLQVKAYSTLLGSSVTHFSITWLKMVHLNHYFNSHVCPSVRPLSVLTSQNFFSLKLPWNHHLTTGADPWGWPRVAPGHAAPPVELGYAHEASRNFLVFSKMGSTFTGISGSKELFPHTRNSPVWSEIGSSNIRAFWNQNKVRWAFLNCIFLTK